MGEGLDFFDANVCLGAGSASQPFLTANDIIEELDRLGIEEALVYHSLSLREPDLGNRRLLEQIRDYGRLHPCWVLVPPFTGEIPPPGKLSAVLREVEKSCGGRLAVRLFPDVFGFPFRSWSLGGLATLLAVFRIPVILEYRSGPIQWDAIAEVLTHTPGLRLIISAESFDSDLRPLYAICSQYENTYVELSGFHHSGGIEDFSERIGVERLIFGTRLPSYDGSQTLSYVLYSELAPREKMLVAGGNLRQLLAHE